MAIAETTDEGTAITVATNEEARELNERIRAQRVHHGRVDDACTVTGSDGLSIGAGDVIQTRKNDSRLQVANRQTWTVQRVDANGAIWAMEATSGRKRQRTVTLPTDYVTEHAHLAYAATAYGAQGVTVEQSHTLLSDALPAAGVYVGMTRARTSNQLHIIAADVNDAREQFVLALERDRADRGLAAATRAAHAAMGGLTKDGPVKLVKAERARLTKQIDRAERQTQAWELAAAAVAQQRDARLSEHREQPAVVVTDALVEQVRARVAASLIDQTTAGGAAVRRRALEFTRDGAGRGIQPGATAEAQAALWRKRVDMARRELAEIEALPVGQAAQLVREREQSRRDAAERASNAQNTRLTERGRGRWQPSANHSTRSADHTLGL
jgi:hypothetical protein